ncbi:MAG: small subunit ribosomal protein S3Ae [Thermoplasmata archaeon]|jgi:small subunit ribosomal protein S3Ae|nr:small subunit ribosomal protein S3Ae [Thermoplasmata archaeon]
MAEKTEQNAKKKVSRTAVKKVKDKWKAKQWYTVRAPPMYNAVPIAETLADGTEKLVGRVAEATLQDLTGDFSKMHIKVKFKVAAVRGNECATKFAGHELTSDYIRRLTRRKHSKIDAVVDVTTKDGFQFRVKPMAVTERRAQHTQEQQIRRLAVDIITSAAQERDHPAFIRDVVNGELGQVVFREARKIYPLKRVEIRKSEVVGEPGQYFETVDLFAAPPQPEPVAETPAEAAPAPEGEAAPAAPAEEEQL